MGYGIDFISIHLERGGGLISEDFVFGCYFLFAGRRACNGKGGGGSEVRAGG